MSSNLFRKAIKEALEQSTNYPKGKITLTYADGPGAGFRSMFYKMSIDVPGSSPDEIANDEFGMDYDQLGPGEQEWVRDEISNMRKDISNEEHANLFLQRNVKVSTPIPEGMQDRQGLAALKAELNAKGYDFSVFEMDVS